MGASVTLHAVSEHAGAAVTTRRPPRLWFIAVAALAALALATPWLWNDEPPAGGVALASPTLADNGQVRLSWRAAGAPRFLIEVRSADRVPRFAGTSETTAIDLPPDVSREILDGGAFVWSVARVGDDGQPTGVSATEPLVAPTR